MTPYVKLLEDAFETVGKVLGYAEKIPASPSAFDDVQSVIMGVLAVIETVRSAKEGTTSPEEAFEALRDLEASIESNDAAADAALAKRFDGEE